MLNNAQAENRASNDSTCWRAAAYGKSVVRKLSERSASTTLDDAIRQKI